MGVFLCVRFRFKTGSNTGPPPRYTVKGHNVALYKESQIILSLINIMALKFCDSVTSS